MKYRSFFLKLSSIFLISLIFNTCTKKKESNPIEFMKGEWVLEEMEITVFHSYDFYASSRSSKSYKYKNDSIYYTSSYRTGYDPNDIDYIYNDSSSKIAFHLELNIKDAALFRIKKNNINLNLEVDSSFTCPIEFGEFDIVDDYYIRNQLSKTFSIRIHLSDIGCMIIGDQPPISPGYEHIKNLYIDEPQDLNQLILEYEYKFVGGDAYDHSQHYYTFKRKE
ncbi:MAG: hypothetical protein JW729_10410 [Bacteroidales bacterium]|nr:hypothetical protein [Bacteroidales bacterium]